MHFLLEHSKHSFSFYCEFQLGLWGHAIIVLKLQELYKPQSTAEEWFSKGTSPDSLLSVGASPVKCLQVIREKVYSEPNQRLWEPCRPLTVLLSPGLDVQLEVQTCAVAGC